jgi:hypothetical protein
METLQVRAHLGESLLACALVESPAACWPVTVARGGAAVLAAGALTLILLGEPAPGAAAALLATALVVLGAGRRDPDLPFEVKRSVAGIELSWFGERRVVPESALPISLSSGELRLELATAPAFERVPRARGRDPERRALLAFAAGSLVIHASVVALALSLPAPVRFGPYPRLSRRLPRVALVATPPRPGAGGALQLWLAHGGESVGPRRPARAGGRAGGGGRLYALRGPRDNPDPHLARRLAEEAARNAGVLSVLGAASVVTANARIANVFGEDALGPIVGNAFGDGYGVGGLGLTGTGRGGGGTGQGIEGSGSLGTLGRGGGGGGGAGYGRGVGMLVGGGSRCGNDGCIPSVIAGRGESRCGGSAARGCLDKETIRRVVRRHLNEVRYCYQKELQLYPDGLDGRVTVRFEIQPDGKVSSSHVVATTLNVGAIESCLEAAPRRWLFPSAATGGVTVVSYPFYFRTAGR